MLSLLFLIGCGEKVEEEQVSTNNEPEVSVSFGIETTKVGEQLICTVTANDAEDGDIADTATFEWSNGGETLDSTNSKYIVGESDDPGDVITCTVTVRDGEGNTASASTDVDVINTNVVFLAEPHIDQSGLMVDEAYMGEVLECDFRVDDVDGDVPIIDIQWYVDGVPLTGETSEMLDVDSSVVSVDQTLKCTVSITDTSPTADGYQIEANSNQVSILGGLPNDEYVFVGEEGRTLAGYQVALDGDIDGDGLDDVVVLSQASGVYVFLGANLSSTARLNLSQADYIVEETSSTANKVGSAVAYAGDVDGDGLDDVLIGTKYGSKNVGASLVFGSSFGSEQYVDLNGDITLLGEDEDDDAGMSIASAGDVDGDGLDDILVGARFFGSSNHNGRVYLYYASTLANTSFNYLADADVVFLGSQHEEVGWSVGGAGDVDGDGLDDIMMGAIFNGSNGAASGQSYLFLGSNLSNISSTATSNADYIFVAEDGTYEDYNNGLLGRCVASAGDVDGDGLDDILLAATGYGYNSNGKTYLFYGASLGNSTSSSISVSTADVHFVGDRYRGRFGFSLSSAGDVDGDGLDDFLIGTKQESPSNNDPGEAYLIFANTIGNTMEYDMSNAVALYGDNFLDYFGSSVSAGDVDGDGVNDVLVGGYGYDAVRYNGGKATLYLNLGQ